MFIAPPPHLSSILVIDKGVYHGPAQLRFCASMGLATMSAYGLATPAAPATIEMSPKLWITG